MDITQVLQQAAADVNIPLISAFLLGLLAAVSPCPLATNISAMAYVSRNITSPRSVMTSGALYTLGRMASYFTIGALIILADAKTARIANSLQDAGERFLGPLLLVVGILMLGIVKLPYIQSGGRLSALGSKVADRGGLGAFALGVIFALAFCPFTAILFFAIMIPMAMESTEGIIVPASFALGSGLPVLIFAGLLSVSVTRVSEWANKITMAEKLIRWVVALVFVGVGIYYITL
ncbi:MAG: aromatic aminobenezylarsenical efflux permease ArsG family transporter [Dehalococcoidia bacterium]|nr:aromatic aminobenezylarsenical efflux permease ArsG family transporter [Dehalococcoidia bacterium]